MFWAAYPLCVACGERPVRPVSGLCAQCSEGNPTQCEGAIRTVGKITHHCARCGATDRMLVCGPCAREEAGRLHQLVCNARELIDPDRAPQWEAEASAEAMRCDDRIDGLVCALNEARARMRLTPEDRATVRKVRSLLGLHRGMGTHRPASAMDALAGDLLAIIDRLAPARAEGATMSGQGQGDESDEIR